MEEICEIIHLLLGLLFRNNPKNVDIMLLNLNYQLFMNGPRCNEKPV